MYDANTVTDATLAEIFDNMLGKIRMNEFDLTSTNRNRIITGMLMNHVDVQLENYQKECEKSKEQDVARRYRIVEMMYLREESLERAYDDLAVLFFGVDGAKMVELRKREIKAKRERSKKNRAK